MKRALAILFVILTACNLFACAPKPEKMIVGTWKQQSSILGVPTETTYEFFENGTGTKSTLLEVSFSYEFSGEKLLITTELLGVENIDAYSYRFDGNQLILTGTKETLTLQRV